MATLVEETGFPALSPKDLAEIPVKTYPLSRKVAYQGEVFDTLTMREPIVDDSIWSQALPGSAEIKEIHALARLCGVDTNVIRLLPASDYRTLQKALMGFFTQSEPTEQGSKSSSSS